MYFFTVSVTVSLSEGQILLHQEGRKHSSRLRRHIPRRCRELPPPSPPAPGRRPELLRLPRHNHCSRPPHLLIIQRHREILHQKFRHFTPIPLQGSGSPLTMTVLGHSKSVAVSGELLTVSLYPNKLLCHCKRGASYCVTVTGVNVTGDPCTIIALKLL